MPESEDEYSIYHFDELIKTLIAFSSSPARQIEICGSGCPGDEMADDFDFHYTIQRQLYAKSCLITPEQFKTLDEFAQYLDNHSGEENEDFWENPNSLYTHPDWKTIRTMAQSCLKALGKSHLGVELRHEIEETTNRTGQIVYIQRTKVELKPKNGIS